MLAAVSTRHTRTVETRQRKLTRLFGNVTSRQEMWTTSAAGFIVISNERCRRIVADVVVWAKCARMCVWTHNPPQLDQGLVR